MVPAKLSLLLAACYCWGRVKAQPAAVHVSFFYTGFPLTVVPVDQFVPNANGMQMLAAVKLAVDDINEGKYLRLSANSLLPNTKVLLDVATTPPSYTDTVLEVNSIITTAFDGTGIDVAIGAILDNVTESIASIFQEADVAQISFNPGSLTSHNNSYYDILRIAPTISYEGKVIADLMTQTFQWTRLAVVSLTDDVDSSDLLYEFTEQAQSNNITILKSLLYNSATTDFSATILETLSLQPEIILVIMKPNTAAPFLEQAYSLGLLSTGVTILGPSYLADASLFSSFSATAPVQSIMKGFIGLSPQMNWTTTDVGAGFISRWQALNNTLGYTDANGTQVCDSAQDDNQGFDLYQQHINYNVSEPYVCAGLNFSTFDASNMYLDAALAYDAMYAAAYGMHELLYTQKLPKVTGALLKQAIINLVPFQGVTGTIDFSNGRTSRGGYGIGDRIDGYSYSVINFTPDLYVSGGNTGFSTVGTCGSDGVVTFTSPPLYNTLNGAMPIDRPPDVYQQMDAQTIAALSACAYVLIALTVLSSLYCYLFRSNILIRVAQPTLLAWTLFGVLMTLIRQLVIMQPVDYSSCVARVYLFHLSFYIVIGSLTAKMYRLHLLCNVSSFQLVDASETTALYYFLMGLGALFFYLVLETTIYPQMVVYNLTVAVNGQHSLAANCAYSNDLIVMDYILIISEGVFLLCSAALCMATRNIPERVNESGITSKILVAGVFYLFVFILKNGAISIDFVLVRILLSVSCSVLAGVVIIFTMLPKLSLLMAKMSKVAEAQSGAKPFLDDLGKPGDREKMERGNKAEKLMVCSEHILLWHVLLNRAQKSSESASENGGPDASKSIGKPSKNLP